MIRKELENIVWLEFELLSNFNDLKHGVLLRHGGVSSDSFGSLNMGFSLTNQEENAKVKFNREKVKKVFNFKEIDDCKLEHKDHIVEITSLNSGSRPTADALATKEKNIALFITHADCQAAIFYDPISKALVNVHAGWRGNVINIYKKTVDFMKDTYGANPTNIHVCISPSLGPNSAEFIHYQTELPAAFWDFQIKPYFFDLWSISQKQLLEVGVLKSHIQIAEMDTLTNEKDFFSYRREKISGRHGTFCSLI
jgi:hypothetical protein